MESPIEDAMNSVIAMQQAQFNMAKLVISWQEFGHTFTVESLNPISAFELADKVKELIKKRMGGKKNEQK
jgi:hypothetical protein